MDNNYKKSAIMKVKKRIEKGKVQQTTETGEENAEPQRYLSIPYVPGTSETTLRRIFSKHNIKCAFYSNDNLAQISFQTKT